MPTDHIERRVTLMIFTSPLGTRINVMAVAGDCHQATMTSSMRHSRTYWLDHVVVPGVAGERTCYVAKRRNAQARLDDQRRVCNRTSRCQESERPGTSRMNADMMQAGVLAGGHTRSDSGWRRTRGDRDRRDNRDRGSPVACRSAHAQQPGSPEGSIRVLGSPPGRAARPDHAISQR